MVDHVVLGDCLAELDRVPDRSVDLVVTDPPYGAGFDFANDKLPLPELIAFTERWLRKVVAKIKPTGSFYCFIDGEHLGTFQTIIDKYLSFRKIGRAINVFLGVSPTRAGGRSVPLVLNTLLATMLSHARGILTTKPSMGLARPEPRLPGQLGRKRVLDPRPAAPASPRAWHRGLRTAPAASLNARAGSWASPRFSFLIKTIDQLNNARS